MNANDFITLTLLAMGGEIQGKTKLQKTVYFLGLLTHSLDELGYRAHFYGPYSDEVAGAVTWLKSIGAIDQNVSSWGIDRSGFEVKRSDFRLNERGRLFAQTKAEQHPEVWRRVKTAAEMLKKAGNVDYMAMSIAAKTYFMLGANGPSTPEELTQLAPQFGWQMTPNQVNQAFKYLKDLNLVHLKDD